MYYYIAEPPTTQNEQKQLDDIRKILDQLGISGEFAITSESRPASDHLELALRKHFTTVVGIGSDSLANAIATTILHYDADKTAMGMIPLHPTTVGRMIGGNSIRDFCNILRARLLVPIDTVSLNPQCAFITTAEAALDQPAPFRLTYDTVQMIGEFTNLSVTTHGLVRIWNGGTSQEAAPTGFMKRLFRPVEQQNLTLTQFVANSWSFETESPIPIAVAGQTVTETPLQVNRRPKTLKLIVNRARISPDNTLVE
jgi:diacylglycerol kinase family enzyme